MHCGKQKEIKRASQNLLAVTKKCTYFCISPRAQEILCICVWKQMRRQSAQI